MRKRTLFGAAAALVTAIAIGAGSSAGASSLDAGNQIAGTWVVTVNRPAPLPPLTSLQVFTSDGSVIENANEASASRTESYGSWERVNGRLYAASALMFRFNPQTGVHAATVKIDRNILLSEDGQTFAQRARATTYDPSGNVVGSFPVVANGERMQIDQIPDQP